MDITKVLEKLGFSPNEIKVYLTLNKNGSTTAGKISKLANIDRSSAYNSLKLLQERGLVSYVLEGNVKYFQVTGPRRLLDYLKEQEEDVKEILPQLQAQHKANKQEGQVRLFKGLKGIRSIFYDIIRTGKDNYVYGSEGQFSERMPEFAHQFSRMKKEKGTKTHMVCRKDRKDIDVANKDYRYAPGIAESPAVTNIYGNKVAIIIWTDEPEGIVIENATAAKAYKSYFDFMWKHSKG
jgi:HTH-type transcriptional regulator, sugar sensing transcriptional regulator